MKIVLAGGYGLIGSAVRARLAKSHEVRTIGTRPSSDMVTDLSEPARVASLALKGCEALIHCAGIVDEDFADPGRAFRQAIHGMAALVKRAKECGVCRFAYVSSAHVYGPFVGTISEASPPNPLHDYAIAHFASEQILRRATEADFRGAALRPCAVFGIPSDINQFRRWALIPFGFPKAAVDTGLIELKSHGLQRRNFVSTDDIAAVVDAWLVEEGAQVFAVVNPVGKESMAVLDFAQLCAQIAQKTTGRPCKIVHRPAPATPPEAFNYTTLYPTYVGTADLRGKIEELIVRLDALNRKRED